MERARKTIGWDRVRWIIRAVIDVYTIYHLVLTRKTIGWDRVRWIIRAVIDVYTIYHLVLTLTDFQKHQ